MSEVKSMAYVVRGRGGLIMASIAAVLMMTVFAKHLQAVENPKPASSAAEQERKKSVVAKVNGVELYGDALEKTMSLMSANTPPPRLEPREETRKKALDQLIFEELVLQQAARLKVRVLEREINRAVSGLKMHDQSNLDDYLASRHLTLEELRAQIRRNILLNRMFEREVSEKISIPAKELKKEYEDHKDQYVEPEKIIVVDVVLASNTDKQTVMKKAEELLARITADKDRNPLNLVNDGTFVVRETEIKKGTDPALYDAIRKIKEGELSGAVGAGDGVHIMKLTGYRPERQMSYEEVRVVIEGRLTAAARKNRIEEWKQELKKDAAIEIREENRGPKPGITERKASAGKD
jgi:parvulin-like peptidyl-prolyl isomerase